MREGKKRWLMSVMRTSGSERKYVINESYAEDRHVQNTKDFAELPQKESIKSTQKFYNGKINYGLLVRFLRGQVGNDWNEVYSEIISRIPTKLLDYKKMVFWFVADKVVFRDGKLWNTESQNFIRTDGMPWPVYINERKYYPESKEFYVNPLTNKLVRIEHKSLKRVSKKENTKY